MARFASIILIALLAACGGSTTTDAGTDAGRDAGGPGDAGHDGGGVDAGGTDAGGTDAGDTDAGDTDAGPIDAGDTDAGPVDAGDTDAGVPIDAGPPGPGHLDITAVSAYSNCMPIISPDPVLIQWTATITGATGPTATLTDATLTVTSGATSFTQHLTVDLPDIALTGGSGSGDQRKTGADMNPTGACSVCGGSATLSLDLTFATAGGSLHAHYDDSYGCVF